MNIKAVFLVIGLLAGALGGWLTRPNTAEIRVGPLSVEVKEEGGALTRAQTQHIAIFAVLGAVIGFGVGLFADRRK